MGLTKVMSLNLFSEIDKSLALAILRTVDRRSIFICMPRKLYWSLRNINPIDFCCNEPPTYKGHPIKFDELLANDGIAILYEKEEYNEG